MFLAGLSANRAACLITAVALWFGVTGTGFPRIVGRGVGFVLTFVACACPFPVLSSEDGILGWLFMRSSSGSTSSRSLSAALSACSARARRASSTTGSWLVPISDSEPDDKAFDTDPVGRWSDTGDIVWLLLDLGGDLAGVRALNEVEKDMRFTDPSSESLSSGIGTVCAIRRSSSSCPNILDKDWRECFGAPPLKPFGNEFRDNGCFPDEVTSKVDIIFDDALRTPEPEIAPDNGEESRLRLFSWSDNEGEGPLATFSDTLENVRLWEAVFMDGALVVRLMLAETTRREADGGEVEVLRGEAGRTGGLRDDVLGEVSRFGAAACDEDVA